MKILNDYVKTSNILDITFESGESWSNPGRACDYMLARVDDTKIYAELPAADDEWEHFDDLLAEIIGLAEDKNIPFNEVKVNGNTISIRATFNVPSIYADYFDDADVYADSLSELEERLNAMQNEADEKMANDWRHTRTLSPSEYYNAPTYASMAQTEWLRVSVKTVYTVRRYTQSYTADECQKMAHKATNLADVFDFDSDRLVESETFDNFSDAIVGISKKAAYFIDKNSDAVRLFIAADVVEKSTVTTECDEIVKEEDEGICVMSEFGTLTYDENGEMTVTSDK